MADVPELWTGRTPERRYLYDQVPTFGLARDAERMRQGVPPERRSVVRPARKSRERGPFLTVLSLPWSYGDGGAGDAWHRMRCRFKRHEMQGGHTMQLGSSVVFIERQCRWCGALA